jgi:hypothetical protein
MGLIPLTETIKERPPQNLSDYFYVNCKSHYRIDKDELDMSYM